MRNPRRFTAFMMLSKTYLHLLHLRVHLHVTSNTDGALGAMKVAVTENFTFPSVSPLKTLGSSLGGSKTTSLRLVTLTFGP